MKKTYTKPNMKWADLEMEESILMPGSPGISGKSANYELEQDVKEDNSFKFNSLWDEEW